MAIMKLQGAGPHHDVAVRGTEITVGTIAVDAAAKQGDGETIVDVYVKKDGSYSLKAANAAFAAFAANIIIPARRYHDEPGTDAEGKDVINKVADPLDANAVEITLWPKP